MNAGIDAPAKIATPTRTKMSRGLRTLKANLELLLFFVAPGASFVQFQDGTTLKGFDNCDVKPFRVGDFI
jgi:hypothetical protein